MNSLLIFEQRPKIWVKGLALMFVFVFYRSINYEQEFFLSLELLERWKDVIWTFYVSFWHPQKSATYNFHHMSSRAFPLSKLEKRYPTWVILIIYVWPHLWHRPTVYLSWPTTTFGLCQKQISSCIWNN